MAKEMHKSPGRAICAGLAVLYICAAFADGNVQPSHPGPDAARQARIEEIARHLPERPGSGTARISDRSTWGAFAALPGAAAYLKRGEQALSRVVAPIPDELYLEFSQNGNRSHYQDEDNARLQTLCDLVMAEILEDKGRFLPKIVEHLDMQCAMRSWVLPAHDRKLEAFNGSPFVALLSSMRADFLATIVDLLDDRLPSETRSRVVGEIGRRVLRPYLLASRDPKNATRLRAWWLNARNNWNSVCNCGAVCAALAVVPERRRRAEFVDSGERTAAYALEGYGDDGYCFEGMGYWNYGYRHYVRLGLAMRDSTGGFVDVFANPKTRTVMDYANNYRLTDRYVPVFADGGGGLPDPLLCSQARRMIWPDFKFRETAPLPPKVSWAGFSFAFFGKTGADAIAKDDLSIAGELPLRNWFPSAQVLVSRIPSARFAAGMKGGCNDELHNHNDVGSYTLVMGGEEVAGDPGGEIYTARTFSKRRYESKVLNSYGHPVPVVGGELQPTGRKFAAKVLKTEFSEMRDTLVLDLTACYQVPSLRKLVRTFLFDRGKRTFTVEDSVSFAEPTAFESPVVTYAGVSRDGGCPARLFLSAKNGVSASVDAAVSGGEWEWKGESLENPGRKSPSRWTVALKKPVLEASVSITFR